MVYRNGNAVHRHGSIRGRAAPQANGGLRHLPVLLVGLGDGQEEGFQGQISNRQGFALPLAAGVDGENVQVVHAGRQGDGQPNRPSSPAATARPAHTYRRPQAGYSLDGYRLFPDYAAVQGRLDDEYGRLRGRSGRGPGRGRRFRRRRCGGCRRRRWSGRRRGCWGRNRRQCGRRRHRGFGSGRRRRRWRGSKRRFAVGVGVGVGAGTGVTGAGVSTGGATTGEPGRSITWTQPSRAARPKPTTISNWKRKRLVRVDRGRRAPGVRVMPPVPPISARLGMERQGHGKAGVVVRVGAGDALDGQVAAVPLGEGVGDEKARPEVVRSSWRATSGVHPRSNR